jgi:hypothetical protein
LESEKNKISQILQTQVNQTSQLQQQLDQQKQRIVYLETENDILRNNLADEQRHNYRSQRSQRNPQ